LALRWTAYAATTLVDAILDVNRAHDWDSFRMALSQWDVPPQNFVYADVEGHIGYQLLERSPYAPMAQGECRCRAGAVNTNGAAWFRLRNSLRSMTRQLALLLLPTIKSSLTTICHSLRESG
jgi:hypothetical protein